MLVEKRMTIREFCRKYEYDLPVIVNVCEKLYISKDPSGLWIFDQNSIAQIKNYLSGKPMSIFANKNPDRLDTICSCGSKIEFMVEQIKKNQRMWILCPCGKKINVTAKMKIIDD